MSAATPLHPLIRLTGPRPRLDPRTHGLRPGAVDIGLAGAIAAARYAVPVPMTAVAPRTPLRAEAADEAEAVSELLYGETFEVLDVKGGWRWGRTVHDQYHGWVPTAALAAPGPAPTHRIRARLAPVFAKASIKAPVLRELPFGAKVAGTVDGSFVALAGGGFVHKRHAALLAAIGDDWLKAAQAFAGAPYLWGGRSPGGVDCSGLVQAALGACGIAVPRDTDQQRDAIGAAVTFADRREGDLVFFPGHVGILATPDRLFHANAFWMTTLDEPLADVIGRLRADGVDEPVLAVRRPALP
jgi:cell wall-associated NlpC family hydrolase